MTQQYESMEGVNWSTLGTMARSPKHYRHLVTHPRADTDAFRLGRLGHRAVLQPHLLEGSVVVWEGGVRRGREWEAFKADNAGRDIVTVYERDQVLGMAEAVHNHPAAQALLAGPCLVESPIQWTDERTGILCKGRVDLVRLEGRRLVELKTARSAEPRAFTRAAATYRYHGQVAYYHDGAECLVDPMIIVVESSPPHDVVVFNAATMLEPGRALYRFCLDRLAACMARDEWPGTSDEAVNLEMPEWAYEYVDGEDAMDWFREES